VADEVNGDVIILGRRGMSNLDRLFVGSTSSYCAENAPCNVIIMKTPEYSGMIKLHTPLELIPDLPITVLILSEEHDSIDIV
jgi:hypothetical protein